MTKRVLVIEDSPDLNDFQAEMAEGFGADVDTAFILSEALKKAKEGGWDIVILDGNLGSGATGEDGRAICEILLQSSKGVYIVGIAGHDFQNDEFWKKHGIFLEKPYEPKEFVDLLFNLIN
ncbi:MAG: response regulator [Candidatus Pacebacteria bacterium]|nr:response regulator [Candidatus Paceibacterota bacterium]